VALVVLSIDALTSRRNRLSRLTETP